MSVQDLLILGANNPENVRVVEAINEQRPNFRLVGFLDNDPRKQGTEFWGFPVVGGSQAVADETYRNCVVVNSITRDTRTRRQTTRELLSYGAKLVNVIHPSVDTRHVRLGTGNLIHEGAVIQPGVHIGNNCCINCNAVVSHECRLGDHVFMAPGSVLAGLVTVGPGVFIGVHSTVLPRLQLGAWSTIGGGAVVIRDVKPGAVVVGNPARPTRSEAGPEDWRPDETWQEATEEA